MLTYDMEKSGRTPLYQYLYQKIREDILSGEIQAGERLPSKRALAKHLNISIITVQNAYELLLAEGYLRSEEKVGYFAESILIRPTDSREKNVRVKEKYERELFADFSSNKLVSELFPIDTYTKMVRQAISMRDDNFMKTIPYNGLAVLRYAIADHLHGYRGINVDPEQIIIGSGSEYLYYRLMQLFPNDTVLGLEDPGNHKFAKIAGKHGMEITYIPLDMKGLDLAKLVRSKVSLLHISPANVFPLGTLYPIKLRMQILSWAYRNEKRYIIEDDFDSEFNRTHASFSSVFGVDYRDRIIYMNSFSKTLMPSLRISYMVLPHSLLQRYRDTLSFYSCTVPYLEQVALSLFISEGYLERHLIRANKYFRTQRELLIKEIQNSPLNDMGILHEPLAGTQLLFEVTRPVTMEKFRENADEQDIKAAFVSDYEAHPLKSENPMLVLNYASIQPERIPEAIRRLSNALTK